MKKIPQRTCIGCNLSKDKKDLIRVVVNKSGNINIDLSYKLEGRGTYICRDRKCLENAIKKKCFSRKLKTEIPNSLYEDLERIIDGGEFIG